MSAQTTDPGSAVDLNRFQIRNPTFTNGPAALEYRDVFIITRSSLLREEVRDASGNVVTPAPGFVRSLRAAGIPVCVLEHEPHDVHKWKGDLEDTVVAGQDRVTISHYRPVHGLERKLVVWLPGRGNGSQEKLFTEEFNETDDRLFAMSRCTTQLVLVEKSRVTEPDLD